MKILATATTLSIVSLLLSVSTVSAICENGTGTDVQVGTDEELAKLTDDKELQDESALTTFNDTLPQGPSGEPAQPQEQQAPNSDKPKSEVTDKCAENGNIAPCLGDEGELIFYCEDPRTEQFEATCMPSPQEWQNLLPSCDSINYSASCAGPEGVPVWTCDDPEYNTKKYDTVCIEPEGNLFTNSTAFSPN